MKKLLTTAVLVSAAWAVGAQSADVFKPYQATDLRMPAVPVIMSDPYFSIWSPYDKLTDGSTRHWSGDVKPLQGYLRVDGETYRFMGEPVSVVEAIAPMAGEEAWQGKIMRKKPAKGWEKESFDDSAWQTATAAFGSYGASIHTPWTETNSDLYVRRNVELTPADLDEDLFLIYSHDDVFELYINGKEVVNTGHNWYNDVELPLSDDIKKLFHAGNNVIAAHCHNTDGGAYTDFGLFRKKSAYDKNVRNAEQKSVDVLATSSYYTFACGPVELDLVFTAPMLIDNYDLLSSPANYISYQVRSTDGRDHNVQLMLTASPRIAQNNDYQPTRTSIVEDNGVRYAKTGTIEQPILAKSGDHICIDWGYLYLPAINGDVVIGPDNEIKEMFITKGGITPSAVGSEIVAYKSSQAPLLAYVHDFGKTKRAASFTMIGYDEIKDIEYFYKQYKAYWAHGGDVDIFEMFDNLASSYASVMDRCKNFDKMIYDDAVAVGGKEYAEILSGSYRHVIGAHKLFKDDEGNLLFFSKENDSNGCVNTVDLTYPEAPLFLAYNPELQKAMMTSILDYSKSGRWTKPFAAHDLGQYPLANGQVYGGDMPLEEAGNMLTLLAQISILDGNTSYADKYWDILKIWADYLSENGQDPENQLCTDDFAGHWAHNANLSVKAIMGVAGFAEMAKLKGDDATAKKYNDRAKEMAAKWVKDAREGKNGNVHYRLAFDRPDTWSQKYNMVWDTLWNTGIFPAEVMKDEIAYYLKKQNKYGLPLDNRRDYTKSDWIMWSAAMSPDAKTLGKFISPLYAYINETPSRVAISDWYDTKTGKYEHFIARSVIGGHWMPLFVKKMKK